MNVFFEESGNFKAGTVLSRTGDALQVELPGGRRAKVKSRDVLVEFEAPAAAELMLRADAAAQGIDLDFLWEVAGADEFNFATLADEYYGAKPGAVERAALALRIHGAPVFFRRKGRGNYQRAPEEQLKAALAALERKAELARVQAGYVDALVAGTLPEAFHGKVMDLLVRPDKNTIEFKALEAAAAARGMTAAQLVIACGGIESPRAWHQMRFIAEFFPAGTGFPPVSPVSPVDELPDADVEAFSIDDITTTEIDDAISVEHLPENRMRVGIHIAAPSLGIVTGDPIDEIARGRLSTVYMPGDKITMLPSPVVEAFTLQEGGHRPAVSLYLIVDTTTYEVVTSETRVEKVFIKHNLRTNLLDPIVTVESLAANEGDYPHRADIVALWPLAQALHEKRQQTRIANGLRREMQRSADFNFYIDGEHVDIQQRRRGAPLDLIVAELAILANSTWGAFLAEYGVPGIYRAQRAFGPNRTRMQTSPAPHEGLGVAQYAWSTSPLRRYVDLVNQWQLVAIVRHGVAAKMVAPFKPKDADLYAIVQGFDETYAAYAEHQHKMERFWCLRWLKQEARTQAVAQVVKGDMVRFEEIPLQLIVPGLGVHARGTRLLLDIVGIDELNVDLSCRLLQVLDAPVVSAEDAAAEAAETAAETAAEAAETAEAPQMADTAETDTADALVDPRAPALAPAAEDIEIADAEAGSDAPAGAADVTEPVPPHPAAGV
ncbi:RNB domain-containing ribonuclease [Robbsia sp. Bb-Pol-6]|uniref:RNB domain-containing ribonuclease n=1 Tax=Robbsia betulipollinis TaxID=2981849 RepID=A0ABT3ZSH5_9BURK|nr:RNB domain-containing ribonuclease [Robbsia betulipollinis]